MMKCCSVGDVQMGLAEQEDVLVGGGDVQMGLAEQEDVLVVGGADKAIELRECYEHKLNAIRKMAFITDAILICNWFLGFCALTWASAVLLGAYVQDLPEWDFYVVSVLLFVEGLRFGVAALLRTLGYRLWLPVRRVLRFVEVFLPLGMGGFALLSLLPYATRQSIHLQMLSFFHSIFTHSIHLQMLSFFHSIFHSTSSTNSTATPAKISAVSQFDTDPAHAATPPPPYQSLSASLFVFYILISANAMVVVLGSSLTGLMRTHYLSRTKSLRTYHDKQVSSSLNDDEAPAWMNVGFDLDFSFKMQGYEYRYGRSARDVCKTHTDLIWFLYMHERGFEAAEAALAAEDSYVREAAANMVGFWAVLESLEDVQGCRLPLRFQRRLLSRLADLAADCYGPAGTASAGSFALLLESDPVGTVTCVRKPDLVDILVKRVKQLLIPPATAHANQSRILHVHAHVHALSRLLLRLQAFTDQTQRAVIVKKMQSLLKLGPPPTTDPHDQHPPPTTVDQIIQSWDKYLSTQLPPEAVDYHSDIKDLLTAPLNSNTNRLKGLFVMGFYMAVPVLCLGVGFLVKAWIHY